MKTVICKDVHGGKHEVSIDKLLWRPSAYGILIRDGEILLSPQFKEGNYDLPGGGVDLGEKFEDAVVREVKEETGVEVSGPVFVGMHTNYFWLDKDHCYQSILMFYKVSYVGGEISTNGFEDDEKVYMRKAEWVPIGRLDEIGHASTFDWREVVKGLFDDSIRD